MNIWKWLFIVLLVVNVTAVITLYLFLSADYGEVNVEDTDSSAGEHAIVLQNHTVEALLNSFLQDDAADSIQVSIDSDMIQLLAENEYLNMNFDTTFDLEPQVSETEIIFEISNISVGQLPLSEDMLYTLIRTSADLPEGVMFSTDSRALIVNKSIFDEYTDLALDVDEIDYQNDAWHFSIENLN